MTDQKLKKCPFCGGKARVTGSESLGTVNYYYVYCMECNARTDDCAGRQSAIEAWNKRVGEVENEQRKIKKPK